MILHEVHPSLEQRVGKSDVVVGGGDHRRVILRGMPTLRPHIDSSQEGLVVHLQIHDRVRVAQLIRDLRRVEGSSFLFLILHMRNHLEFRIDHTEGQDAFLQPEAHREHVCGPWKRVADGVVDRIDASGIATLFAQTKNTHSGPRQLLEGGVATTKDADSQSQDINKVAGETVGGEHEGVLDDASFRVVRRVEFSALRVPSTHGVLVVGAALVPNGVVIRAVLLVVFGSKAISIPTLIAVTRIAQDQLLRFREFPIIASSTLVVTAQYGIHFAVVAFDGWNQCGGRLEILCVSIYLNTVPAAAQTT